MSKRIWFSCLALMFVSATQQGVAVAKPGDLPFEITQQCPEGSDGPMSEGFSPPRHGEGSCPQTGSARGENGRNVDREAMPRETHQVRESMHRVRRVATGGIPCPRETDARQLFELAEQLRLNGDCTRARICYEEAHLVSPTSPCGRLAIDRLRDLDQTRFGATSGGTEEAEPDGQRRSLRDVGQQRRHRVDFHTPEAPRRENAVPREGDSRRQRMLQTTVPLGGSEESDYSTSKFTY